MRRCVLVSLALLFGGGEVLAQQKRDCEASLRLKPGDTEYALSRGICHLNNGDADLAISDFDQFIALNPTWVAGYFNRGNAYYRKQDYDRAIEDFGQALRLSPSTPESMLLNRGNAYGDKRDYEKAIADYSEAIRLKPKFDELYRIRGDTYERKGEFDRARDDYRAALALNPGNRASSEGLKRLGTAPAPLVQVVTIANPRIGEVRLDWCREWARSCGKAAADEFCRSQGFVEARSFVKAPRLQEPTRVIGTGQTCSNASCDGFASIACRKAESPPPSPPAASLGQCDRTAHPDQRIAACTAVVERGEGGNNILASAYLNRCDAQAFSGKLDQALADCSKAIELDPAAAFAFAIRGRLHSMKREYELALKDMDEAIRLQPRESGFLCDRASVYEAAGQAERAIEDYSQAIRLDPRAGQPYISRGILYSNGGKLAEALADFNAVINLDPKSHVAFFNRGTVYRRMVQYDSAIADYDEAIRLSPTYVLAYLRRADAYFDKGQYDRAVDDYSQGLAHRPNDPTIYYLRARANAEGGHYDRALADHGEALRINPRFALAFNGRAWTYYKMGKDLHSKNVFEPVSQSVQGRPHIHFTAIFRSHIFGINNRYSSEVPEQRAMPVPRSLYLVIGAVAAPVGLCVSATMPVAGVLAGTIAVGLVVLVSAAGALLAVDWRAELQSRQAWAELAPAMIEGSLVAASEAAPHLDPRYLPACDNDALRDVFRVHRILRPQAAAEMELPVASSAPQAAPTPSFPTRTGCQAAQGGRVDGENDVRALLSDGPIDQATLGASRARPTNSLTFVAGRQRAGDYCVVDGTRVRLTVNAGPNCLASGWAVAKPSHAAEVIVLSSCRDAQHTRPAEAATETVCATGTQPPNCRGPPSLEQPRSARRVATQAGSTAPAPKASPDGDPLVLDDLGQPVPVCAAEVNVIETYLGDVLEELFASSKASSEPERA